jgi:hypothetical protein
MSKSYIPDAKVAKRYSVHPCTIDRWERDPKLNFPKAVRIRNRKYRDQAELDAWDLMHSDQDAA